MIKNVVENSSNVDIKTVPKEYRSLQIRNKLPQIIISDDKVEVFSDWWNQDLRFLASIPRSFDEGYLIIDSNYNNTKYAQKEYYRPFVKKLANMYNCSFSKAEDLYLDLLDTANYLYIHFIFESDNDIRLYVYDRKMSLHSSISFKVGDNPEPSDPIDYKNMLETTDFSFNFNYFCMVMFACAMWYLATSNKDKYYYEKSNNVSVNEDKDVVYVKKHKVISTPVYDFNKVRQVKVAKLIQHRKGWTYSHSFKVHGHYRHYKNGKVIFVESFTKGKGKEFQNQTIRLEPKI
jgi:hypothetical protein